MKITRKDVAKYAGVSEQTVSYVLNKSRKFSADVVSRVNNAVKELNYQPDMIAKSMSKKRTNTVALFAQDIENPIFPAIIHSFQEKASEFGYSVYIADIKGCKDINSLIASLISRRIDGIYISMFSDEDFMRIANHFKDCGIKVVLGNVDAEIDDIPSVTVDFADGMRKIVEYLRDCGHEKIVYISGIDINQKNDVRYVSFVNEYEKLFQRKPIVVENDFPYATTVETGIRLAEKLLSDGEDFTAVVTTNDLMAYGVIDCLLQHGKRVPEDVSVIGIDDIMFSKYIMPPLTTLGYDNMKLGGNIFEVLRESIEGKSSLSRKVQCYIVERDSVKNIKQNDK